MKIVSIMTTHASGGPAGSGSSFRLRGRDLVWAAAEDLRAGAPAGVVAARFHRGLAGGVVAACVAVRAERGLSHEASKTPEPTKPPADCPQFCH